MTLHYTAYDPSRLASHHLPTALHRQGPIAGYHKLTTSLQEDRQVIMASSLSQCMHARASVSVFGKHMPQTFDQKLIELTVNKQLV